MSDFLMHKIKTKRHILKRIGPNIEPCSTHDKKFWNVFLHFNKISNEKQPWKISMALRSIHQN